MAGDTLITRPDAEAALFAGPRLFAPIRHHSPACAWMLRAMIRDHQPEVILIEGPSDLNAHIPLIADPATQPPIAIAALGAAVDPTRPRPVSYYPISDHAPEFIAITEGIAIGAEVRFIDLPISARLDDTTPPLQSEAAFTTADFIAKTCARLGLRDGSELWDHLFETRLGQTDWRHFFADVYAYCMALRETTDPAVMDADDTLRREAHMRHHIAGLSDKRAVIVTGGFHTPALVAGDKGSAGPKPSEVESYLVSYGEAALDAYSGYAAGLRYPGWYHAVWQATLSADGPPDWLALAVQTTTDFAGADAEIDRRVPLPQLVEMLEIATGLAQMKGRDAVLLPDLFDGMRTALIKTEAGPGEPYTLRFHDHLRGTRLGQVPPSAGMPPLVADARTRAAKARIDLSDSAQRPKKLDIRRKDTHKATSQYLYQMDLLGTGLGRLDSGPDFLIGARTDLLFEEWLVAWSPFVEGALIKAARYGATVPRAAITLLMADRQALYAAGQGADLSAILDLLLKGLRAGLGAELAPLAADLHTTAGTSPDFDALARTIARLQAVSQPGDPLHDPDAPDLLQVARVAFDRMLYLLADLTQTPDEALPDRIAALRTVAAVLRGPHAARFDRPRFEAALDALLSVPACPPLLQGALMGLLVRAGLHPSADLARLLRGALAGIGLKAEDRAAALNGVLMTAPMLLWQDRAVLAAAEAALAALDEDAFLDLLPALRLALTQLNPHETDRLAEELMDLLDLDAGALHSAPSHFSEAALQRGLALDRAIRATVAADDLGPAS